MIVNHRIELSDEERNDLARRIDRKDTKRLVTRNEVRELVDALLQQEIKDAEDVCTDERGDSGPDNDVRSGSDGHGDSELPGDGSEDKYSDYLPDPRELERACKRVLEHLQDSREPDGPLNVGWCVSILIAAGV